MSYRVIIKKCDDPARAAAIAQGVAQLCGAQPSVIQAALQQKQVCVRRDATDAEAADLKARLERMGAVVSLEPVALDAGAAAAVGARPAVQPVARPKDDDDDDDEPAGRIRTDAELAATVKERPEIFKVEKDNRAKYTEIICVILGILLGVYLNNVKIVEVATDFYEKIPEDRMAKIVKDLPETLKEDKKLDEEKKKKEEKIESDRKTLKQNKKAGAGGRYGGGGDPRARVTRKGVLGIISGQVKGRSVASADVFGKGGFASGIDAILSGVGGLKGGGDGGVGRKGAAGIGYGSGYGSGFGGGGGGIDDLIGSLMGGEGGELGLKKRGSLQISEPKFVQGGALTGGRSKASIMRVVMQNIAALRYAYNKRLREKPGLKGRITVKFAIDEFGAVIFADVVNSTMADSDLEAEVVAKIKRWAFGKIDKPGDVTEVIYPFVFSQ